MIFSLSFIYLQLSENIQERLKFLEGRLAEEKGWRKQLEVDLSVTKAALKTEKEVMSLPHMTHHKIHSLKSWKVVHYSYSTMHLFRRVIIK